MSTFYYTAKSPKGETEVGTLEAKDKHDLAQALRKKGYILTSAKLVEEEKKKKKKFFGIRFGELVGRVSLVDKLMFTRHLAVMITAGFSLHQGLEVLARQTENKYFKKILGKLIEDLKKGQPLASGLAKYPRVFNGFFVSMVKVGEKGGSLEEVLQMLATHMKREHDLQSKIRGAMFYPVVILVAMVGIIILMMIMVVPKLVTIFEEMAVELPVTTQLLIKISKFTSDYFYIAAGIFLVLLVILGRFSRTKKGKKMLSFIFLKAPLFGKITKKINCARFARTFSSLMESGVPVIESLIVTSQTVTNTFYSNSLVNAAEKIKKGGKIQECLDEYKKLYPVLVTQMVGVGEQTGELSNIMQRLADFYEEEVKNITDNLTSIIEPILMIILGGAVAFFAISMIQPMYSMMGAI